MAEDFGFDWFGFVVMLSRVREELPPAVFHKLVYVAKCSASAVAGWVGEMDAGGRKRKSKFLKKSGGGTKQDSIEAINVLAAGIDAGQCPTKDAILEINAKVAELVSFVPHQAGGKKTRKTRKNIK